MAFRAQRLQVRSLVRAAVVQRLDVVDLGRRGHAVRGLAGTAQRLLGEHLQPDALPRAAAPPRSLALPVVGLVGVAGALALAFFLGESASRTPPPPPPSTATSVAPPTDVAPPESAALVDAAAEDAGTDAGLLPEDAALELAPHHDPAPRHFAVHYTGCDAHALFDTSAVHAAFDRVSGDVAACVHAPTGPMNFDLTVTGDGEVVSVAPHGTPAPGTPALRACVMRALRGASMGTRSRSGEGGIVTVSFRDGR